MARKTTSGRCGIQINDLAAQGRADPKTFGRHPPPQEETRRAEALQPWQLSRIRYRTGTRAGSFRLT
jgi:hypothetical protein